MERILGNAYEQIRVVNESGVTVAIIDAYDVTSTIEGYTVVLKPNYNFDNQPFFNGEVKTMEPGKVEIKISIEGIKELEEKLQQLQDKMKEVESLADEITSIKLTISYQKKD